MCLHHKLINRQYDLHTIWFVKLFNNTQYVNCIEWPWYFIGLKLNLINQSYFLHLSSHNHDFGFIFTSFEMTAVCETCGVSPLFVSPHVGIFFCLLCDGAVCPFIISPSWFYIMWYFYFVHTTCVVPLLVLREGSLVLRLLSFFFFL